MQRARFIFSSWLFLSGCAAQATSSELSRIRQELHDIREAQLTHQKWLVRLERQLEDAKTAVSPSAPERSPSRGARSTPNRRLGSAPVSLDRRMKSLPVVRLGETEGPAPRGPDGMGAQDRGQPPVMIRIRGEQGPSEQLTVDRQILKRPDPVLDRRRAAGADVSYQRALSTLREDRDPRRALELFAAFIAAHPKHHLVDNAVYWTGEAHQMLVEHERAIEAFERLLHAYPRSNKVPWAKLRVAQSQMALGRTDAGRALLEGVRSEHPRSEPARIAASLLTP